MVSMSKSEMRCCRFAVSRRFIFRLPLPAEKLLSNPYINVKYRRVLGDSVQ